MGHSNNQESTHNVRAWILVAHLFVAPENRLRALERSHREWRGSYFDLLGARFFLKKAIVRVQARVAAPLS
jgi:hypothetical protein